ncbi:hypothetical protein F4778DRAFT_208548 [Xylariomycetidae sp. FL2044]|nr:hypothetical protein F4778DRAFT_208548 [Xylariomycetidae sp. FL2044]
MADTRRLRVVAAATFPLAFPFCLAHGIVSRSPVPAVGLVPLAFSASTSIFLVRRQARMASDDDDDDDHAALGGDEEQRHDAGGGGDDVRRSTKTERPVLVFVVDTILAAALLVVLVFTWIRTSGRADLAMLAAYATIPLLTNVLIHLYLAASELSRGLALRDLSQWLAWQVVPADCPHCRERLRPSSAPTMPWFQSMPRMGGRLKLPAVPKMPRISTSEWRTPKWLRDRTGGRAFVASGGEGDDENRYTDYPESGEPSTSVAEPETVRVIGKKQRGSRVPQVSSDEL